MYASCFKLKHVAAPGQDPLARGWTRGGEIYLWQPKGVKAEGDVAWPPVATVRGEPVTLAAVQPPPVAMDDSYTGPAPSAYEAQAANYR